MATQPNPQNQDHRLLLKNGWQFEGYAKLGKGNNRMVMLWSHEKHRHQKHQFFSLGEAVAHQKFFDEERECYCGERNTNSTI